MYLKYLFPSREVHILLYLCSIKKNNEVVVGIQYYSINVLFFLDINMTKQHQGSAVPINSLQYCLLYTFSTLYTLSVIKKTIREFRKSITTTEDNQSATSNIDFAERNRVFLNSIFKKYQCIYDKRF